MRTNKRNRMTKNVSIWMTPEMYQDLQSRANDRGYGMSEYIRHLIEQDNTPTPQNDRPLTEP